MLEDDNQQLREQVMSPRERDQQVNAVQDRQLAFRNPPANVAAENRRQENREYHDGGNVYLQQRNILQQVIHQFQQPPQLEMILENQRDVMHQLVQEAHRVRQEVKDMKTAMTHALQTVDTNHAHKSNYPSSTSWSPTIDCSTAKPRGCDTSNPRGPE